MSFLASFKRLNPGRVLSKDEEYDVRRKCSRFRVLIIGRANAGKTTILKSVCGTTEEPVIYDSKGKKINNAWSILKPSAERGEHDIDNQMVFESNPGFVFHDSRGFETGSAQELERVKAFISERSQRENLMEQIHVIWYCIPVDDSRPYTRAEINFFDEVGTGDVPVVAVLTKFDALDTRAFAELEDPEGDYCLSWEDAQEQAPKHAEANFELHLKFMYEKKFPPKGHVLLRDMNKDGALCQELTACTAAVIDNDTLMSLFVSTQRSTLEQCMKDAVKVILKGHGEAELQQEIQKCFPHIVVIPSILWGKYESLTKVKEYDR